MIRPPCSDPQPHPTVLADPLVRPVYALISVHGDPAAEIGREGAGGQNIYVREVGLALARLGYSVDLFTRCEHPNLAPIVHHAPGCRTIRLTAGPLRFIDRMDLYEYLGDFVAAFVSFQQEQRRNYAVLHTHYWDSAWVGLQLKARLGLPLVHTNHSLGAIKYQATEEWHHNAPIRLAVERQVLEEADCVVATSPQEAADLRRLVSLQGQIRVIPCGTDIERFGLLDRAQAREQLGIPGSTRMVLYAGRFDPRKGIDTLVQAVALLPEDLLRHLRLYLVGGSRHVGPDHQERERIGVLVTQLGLEAVTVFTGRLPQVDLALYYAAADVCVVPSHYEPFGLVALEAMASGTPVIASDVGGLPFTVVPKETGALVPPADAAALALALTQVFIHPQVWQEYGRRARERVHTYFSWSAVATQLAQLFQGLRPRAERR
ncbi:glycosyltransferase [Anthocerotibacter panamensis]|uniref:glycosyltransferase n=1 Tax=Anthocerotibacter panamensis TaxID=2857077 RepID=UPI001C407778|nr:glycosyltransferase [Anthocerotibacter panamensis]